MTDKSMGPKDRVQYKQALLDAKQAVAEKNFKEARRLARLATRLNPQSEAAWLLLAAASEPRPGLAYAAKALEINPDSQAARKAVRYLVRRVPRNERQEAIDSAEFPENLDLSLAPWDLLSTHRLFSWRGGLAAVGLATVLVLMTFGLPAVASQPQSASDPLNKATFTPTSTPTFTPTATVTLTPTVTITPTPTDTPPYTPPPNASTYYTLDPNELAPEGRWIDVDLGNQTVTAYEGATPVRSFIVSTGTASHPTVTGQYRVYIRLTSTPMAGPGYYLPGVPYTMYFFKGYALHGTYWHSNFGVPMSHGCVNLRTPDAEWLFYWASVGTLVNVHP